MEINVILNKIDKNLKLLEEFPHMTCSGKWIFTKDTDWANGFWVGLLWLSYRLTNDKKYKEAAYKWLSRIEERRNDKTFDLGFLFYPSFVLGYKITKDEYLRKVALEAAGILASLFNEKSSFVYNDFIMNGKKVGRTIIDVMMELPLLWWAYEETGNEGYYDVAYKHCQSTMVNLIRSDYSTIHVLDFDISTGEIIRKATVQGYSDDSCWSRGQAWAIYGFTLAYKASHEIKFLQIAQGLADYFTRNLPDDLVPYWDFNAPQIPSKVRDSSAAAIACSGLLTLAELSRQQKFKVMATRMLNSLGANYLTGNDSEGILKYGCYHKPENLSVDESLIWSDYYFVEAVAKTLGKTA